jgi:hypothetical protein
MPFPDSEYPSILRGRDKRESQRLMAAAPEMLAALQDLRSQIRLITLSDWSGYKTLAGAMDLAVANAAIAKAEGRE